MLARVKMIAEPWDIGMGGYQLGGYPRGWSEWNDRFRDAARGFWRGDSGTLAKLTQGLTGSRETFAASGRSPLASINFIASHDGYTLADTVAYEEKHNHANGEDNRDGHGHNVSRNYGAEGDTDDPAILGLRARQKRNMLATVMLAQGVPMLLMGDERSRSQGGNNNAYCQDNPTSWMDWTSDPDPELTAFVAHLLAFRRAQPALRRRAFFTGELVDPTSPCATCTGSARGPRDGRRPVGRRRSAGVRHADRQRPGRGRPPADPVQRRGGGRHLPPRPDRRRPLGAGPRHDAPRRHPGPDAPAYPAGGAVPLPGRAVLALTASGAFVAGEGVE